MKAEDRIKKLESEVRQLRQDLNYLNESLSRVKHNSPVFNYDLD